MTILAKHSLAIRATFGGEDGLTSGASGGCADSRALERGSFEAVARQNLVVVKKFFCSGAANFLQWRGRFFAVARKIWGKGEKKKKV